MAQVDMDTLVSVSGGADRKIACQSVAGNDPPEKDELPESSADHPPQSFCLSKDAELDWFDHNAFIQRAESTKGYSININSSTSSSSRRLSLPLKSRTSIIGLPNPHKSRRRYKLSNARLFTKKSSMAVAEPSSPKVSCIGRVRSRKSKNRRSRNRRAPEPAKTREKPGWLTKFKAMFRSNRNEDKPKGADPVSVASATIATWKDCPFQPSDPPVHPSGLGNVKQFASSRRSISWGGVADVDSGNHVTGS